MRKNVALILCLIPLVIGATSCGFRHSKSDVARYLGLNEDEIVKILGTPTGWCGGQSDPSADGTPSDANAVSPRRIMYRSETASLPEPLTGIDFVFSDAGSCREVAGYTSGFDSPEELLAQVGIRPNDLNRLSENDSAIRFRTPELSIVDVHKPNRVEGRYADFVVAS